MHVPCDAWAALQLGCYCWDGLRAGWAVHERHRLTSACDQPSLSPSAKRMHASKAPAKAASVLHADDKFAEHFSGGLTSNSIGRACNGLEPGSESGQHTSRGLPHDSDQATVSIPALLTNDKFARHCALEYASSRAPMDAHGSVPGSGSVLSSGKWRTLGSGSLPHRGSVVGRGAAGIGR